MRRKSRPPGQSSGKMKRIFVLEEPAGDSLPGPGLESSFQASPPGRAWSRMRIRHQASDREPLSCFLSQLYGAQSLVNWPGALPLHEKHQQQQQRQQVARHCCAGL